MHDFGALITSVREGGSSIADISGHVISVRAKMIFSLFVWLALILVIAVFVYLCADTFVQAPQIVVPSLGLIPVAVIVGYLLYYVRANSVLATILGLAALTGLIFLGNFLPIKAGINVWIVVLLVYCYFASILPVNILLQPRDYLSSFLLFFGIGVGYIGLFLSHPKIIMPSFNGWASSEGYLWPTLFVTVACGAVSGFHALIASGTSSKQIANERHAKRIGYGGMVIEGIVAVLAIITVAIMFGPGEDLGAALKTQGPIGIFGSGYGRITNKVLFTYGPFIAITILNAFILTTLDTATRISRYMTEEIFPIKNRYFSTAIIIILSGGLAFSGQWQRIWPAFGAANQLIAALVLFILSCWLFAKGKTTRYTIWPACFMFITTIAALVLQVGVYFKNKDLVLIIVTISLIILACFMAYEAFKAAIKMKKNSGREKYA